MPYSRQLSQPEHELSPEPVESDVEHAERVRQEILVSARQLLYAFQPSGGPELRAAELNRMSQKVKLLEDVARVEREAFALGVLDMATQSISAQRQYAHDAAKEALAQHFRTRASIEQAMRPMTDTGAIILKLGQQTVDLFYKQQK